MYPYFACPRCKRVIVNCVCELTPEAAQALAEQYPKLVPLRERVRGVGATPAFLDGASVLDIERLRFARWLVLHGKLAS